jgi:hypothetical protein
MGQWQGSPRGLLVATLGCGRCGVEIHLQCPTDERQQRRTLALIRALSVLHQLLTHLALLGSLWHGRASRILHRGGANLLRHSVATSMLRVGATLDTIGAVLQHRSATTTAHYAKVDVPMLLQVTQPWPGESPCSARTYSVTPICTGHSASNPHPIRLAPVVRHQFPEG